METQRPAPDACACRHAGDDAFLRLLRRQQARYPLLGIQDVAKLCYQSEFGPEHMAPSPDAALAYLREEWASLPADAGPREMEPIGNGLCRFPLRGVPEEGLPLLASLFCRTAAAHTGTRAGLETRLACAEELPLPGGGEWLADYRGAGCPPVHHSAAFREAYHPHYRLVDVSFGVFFPVLLTLEKLLARGGHPVVAVDGDCGSGKTTLAHLLTRLFPCRVFHTDDYYLPPSARGTDWERTPCGHMDLRRLEREVLQPAGRGETVAYRSYDCHTGRLRPVQTVSLRPLTVVEGSYCLAPSLRPYYDACFFLTCAKDEQRRRLMTREGDYYPAFEQRWIPLEALYHRACAPRLYCGITVATDALTAVE